MSYSLKSLRNSSLFSGLVVYRYYCETFKRSRPHTINPVTDKAKLKFRSDELVYKIERKRWYEEYIKPNKKMYHSRKYMVIKKRVDAMSYEKITTIYKVTMNPILNTLQD